MARNVQRPILKRAPLVLVLAQVRFSSVLKMKDFLPEIQDQLRRDGFPKFRTMQTETEIRVVGLEPARRTSDVHWEFVSKDDRTVAILGTESISLSTTSYLGFEQFTSSLAAILRTVTKAASITLRERIGLRYVDVIIPSKGKQISDYIAKGLLGLSLQESGVKDPSFSSAMAGSSPLGTFVIRSFRRSQGLVLPPDLLPLKLQTDKPLNADGEFCTLDFDHFNEGTKDFDVEQTMKEFEELHDLIEQAFRQSVLESALEEWK